MRLESILRLTLLATVFLASIGLIFSEEPISGMVEHSEESYEDKLPDSRSDSFDAMVSVFKSKQKLACLQSTVCDARALRKPRLLPLPNYRDYLKEIKKWLKEKPTSQKSYQDLKMSYLEAQREANCRKASQLCDEMEPNKDLYKLIKKFLKN